MGSVLSFFREKESTKENAPSSAGRLALTRRAAWLVVSGNEGRFGIVAVMVLCFY